MEERSGKHTLDHSNTCKLTSFEPSIIQFMCIQSVSDSCLSRKLCKKPQTKNTDFTEIFVLQQIPKGQNCHSDIYRLHSKPLARPCACFPLFVFSLKSWCLLGELGLTGQHDFNVSVFGGRQ